MPSALSPLILHMNKPPPPSPHKSGYVAIVGKPNAGKSTLLNAILGTKISIATHKPQTTRHRIIGIYSEPDAQIIFLDTPGLIHPRYRLQESMMEKVNTSYRDADIVLFVVEATEKKLPGDAFEPLKAVGKPVILVVNKMDLLKRSEALPLVDRLSKTYPFEEILPVSALKNSGLDTLMAEILKRLPPGPPFYPKDQVSEHPERFFVAELIREQIFLLYQEEIPYSCAVNIVQYRESEDKDIIDADIVVARDSQKGILIGKKGQALKKLGRSSRKSIEEFLGKKTRLNLYVKARDNWREKDTFLREYGYE